MKKINLGGTWQLRRADESKCINAAVPGTVYTAMLDAQMIPDPYYRDNSAQYEAIMEYDYVYSREFELDEAVMNFKNIILCCEGLDTLCDISLNGKKVASTDNMHRTWKIDVKNVLKQGKNDITVLIKSPVNFCREKYQERPLAQVKPEQCLTGFPYIRKAHCMFGWDWSPKMPDGGIWRDIYLSADNGLKIESVFVTQEHTEDGKVFLNAFPEVRGADRYSVEFDGKIYEYSADENICIEVENPKLWQITGYGEQYLYDFKFSAYSADEQEDYSCRIGLRKAEFVTENDEYGMSMYFRINGIPVFAKGANYIIEDNVISRYSPERTRDLLMQAKEANHNIVRVWGGAIFPPDYFFDICDELGLMVWEDLPFACAQYPDTEEFYENISREAEDNIKRLRNHASLVLWCGNNECEEAFAFWWKDITTDEDRRAYIVQYEKLLKGIVEKFDPTRRYWPSSPSGGGDFRNTTTDSIGDVHYWDIWFKQKPLDEYVKYNFRFLSEFGFQSFPAIETIREFTAEEDRNIFSKVMEHHQRDGAANGRILQYMSREFRYPKDLDSLAYVSQIMQAEAIRVGVEHMRKNRNNCRSMGAIYWQINDCWPVASWSSLDYYGRWKALHYSSKRFFDNVLLSSVFYEGNKILLALTNDRTEPVSGTVYYKVKDKNGTTVREEKKDVTVGALSLKNIYDFVTDGIDKYNQYVEYGLDGEMKGAVIICPNKHFEFENPHIEYNITYEGGKSVISLKSKSFANFVEIKANNNTVRFSDNYFALSAGVEKKITCDEKIDEISVRSVYDTY